MINIEPKEDRLLYIDSVTSFTEERNKELYDLFDDELNNSDEINETWKPELSKRDVSVGITIREIVNSSKLRISLFTDLDNGPIENDYLIDMDNFVDCVIENLKNLIEDIDFRMSIIDKAKSFNNDIVNHPGHYETGKFECIEVMQEALGVDAVKNFCVCNAFKYIYRHKRKNGLEDIKKAKWYIDKLLELSEEESNIDGQ